MPAIPIVSGSIEAAEAAGLHRGRHRELRSFGRINPRHATPARLDVPAGCLFASASPDARSLDWCTARVKQEFAVAGGALDRAFDDADHGPAGLRPDPGRHPLADRLVNGGVAHDAALADRGRAGLELRLDQRDELRPVGGQRQ